MRATEMSMTHRQLVKAARRTAQERHLPALRAYCAEHGISMREVEHGWQFERREYVINWNPATNKVVIQYRLPGHGETIRFTRSGQPNKPRIVVALEELVSLGPPRPELPLRGHAAS